MQYDDLDFNEWIDVGIDFQISEKMKLKVVGKLMNIMKIQSKQNSTMITFAKRWNLTCTWVESIYMLHKDHVTPIII